MALSGFSRWSLLGPNPSLISALESGTVLIASRGRPDIFAWHLRWPGSTFPWVLRSGSARGSGLPGWSVHGRNRFSAGLALSRFSSCAMNAFPRTPCDDSCRRLRRAGGGRVLMSDGFRRRCGGGLLRGIGGRILLARAPGGNPDTRQCEGRDRGPSCSPDFRRTAMPFERTLH